MNEAGLKSLFRAVRLAGLPRLAMIVAVVEFAAAMQAQQPAVPRGHATEGGSSQAHRLVVERAFAPDGMLSVVVNTADVRIVRNPDPAKIRLEMETQRPVSAAVEQRWLRRLDVEGDRASLEVQFPRQDGSVTLYVPSLTSLAVNLRSGRLTVSGVTGNKDLRVESGSLTLREARGAAYRHVEAEVKFGSLTDGVFHARQSGWWGRAFTATGAGSYVLLLHVGTGDLVLTDEDGGL